MIPTQRIHKGFLWLGMGLPLLAVLTMGWFAHQTSIESKESFDWVTHSYKVLNFVALTQEHMVDIETGQRGYLLTGREEYLEPCVAATSRINQDIENLKNLTADNSKQQANIVELKKLVAARIGIVDKTIAARRTNFNMALAIVLTDEGRKTMNQIRNVLFQMRGEEENLLAERQKYVELKSLHNRMASFALISVDVLALAAVIFVLLRLDKLQQLVTVCAWTGQVKYDGEWIRVDEYLKRRFGLTISHGLSKEAAEKMKREIELANPPDPRS